MLICLFWHKNFFSVETFLENRLVPRYPARQTACGQQPVAGGEGRGQDHLEKKNKMKVYLAVKSNIIMSQLCAQLIEPDRLFRNTTSQVCSILRETQQPDTVPEWRGYKSEHEYISEGAVLHLAVIKYLPQGLKLASLMNPFPVLLSSM